MVWNLTHAPGTDAPQREFAVYGLTLEAARRKLADALHVSLSTIQRTTGDIRS